MKFDAKSPLLSAQLLNCIGLSQMKQSAPDAAVESFRRSASLNPTFAGVYSNMAEALGHLPGKVYADTSPSSLSPCN